MLVVRPDAALCRSDLLHGTSCSGSISPERALRLCEKEDFRISGSVHLHQTRRSQGEQNSGQILPFSVDPTKHTTLR